ncbi:hypothetical protein BKA80DRAFT_269223 [Phyllosticta citrichinensis]
MRDKKPVSVLPSSVKEFVPSCRTLPCGHHAAVAPRRASCIGPAHEDYVCQQDGCAEPPRATDVDGYACGIGVSGICVPNGRDGFGNSRLVPPLCGLGLGQRPLGLFEGLLAAVDIVVGEHQVDEAVKEAGLVRCCFVLGCCRPVCRLVPF